MEFMERMTSACWVIEDHVLPLANPPHYRSKVYAFDTTLNLPQGSSREDLERSMNNHITAMGVLIGTYGQ